MTVETTSEDKASDAKKRENLVAGSRTASLRQVDLQHTGQWRCRHIHVTPTRRCRQ